MLDDRRLLLMFFCLVFVTRGHPIFIFPEMGLFFSTLISGMFFQDCYCYGGTPLKQSTHVKSEQLINEEGVFQSRNLTGFSIKRETLRSSSYRVIQSPLSKDTSFHYKKEPIMD